MEERTAQRGDGSEADSVHLSSVVRPPVSWRTPAVILACGCLIALLGFGARSGLGFFLTPMSSAHGWGRDVFALALAIQMLLWGAAQPLAGAVADRYGALHGLRGHAGDAASHRRRGDRFRARRLLLHYRARRIRQADATAVAHARLRRRDGGRLVRAIPVLSARGRAHRLCRLAGHARHLRCRRASHHAAVARARIATAGRRARGGKQSRAPIGGTGAERGARPQELRPARARLL